jgi:hypothetical protein
VSAEAQSFEVGLGAVYTAQELGLTGYMQYSLTFLRGRLQLDLLADRSWNPQFTLGVPLTIKDLSLEPHLVWSAANNQWFLPNMGLRVQYQF